MSISRYIGYTAINDEMVALKTEIYAPGYEAAMDCCIDAAKFEYPDRVITACAVAEVKDNAN